jgi:hypothetical protein
LTVRRPVQSPGSAVVRYALYLEYQQGTLQDARTGSAMRPLGSNA